MRVPILVPFASLAVALATINCSQDLDLAIDGGDGGDVDDAGVSLPDSGPYVLLDYDDTVAPFSIAVDGTNVFWTNTGSGGAAVYKVSEKGGLRVDGGADKVLAKAPSPSSGIALDETYVYWASDDAKTNGVVRAPKGGGAVSTVITVPISAGQVSADESFGSSAIAVDANNVYFTLSAQVSGAIMSAPKGGGTAVTLASTVSAPPASIAVDGSTLYWVADTSTGSTASAVVASVPVAGGAVATLVSAGANQTVQVWRGALVVGTSNLYWLENNLSTLKYAVVSMPKAGGTVTTIVSPDQKDAPGALAIDATNLYWSTGHSLVRVSLSGGSPSTFATDFPFPSDVEGTFQTGGLVVDSSSVYFTLSSTTYAYGYVLKVAK